jgi:hypothetical protein
MFDDPDKTIETFFDFTNIATDEGETSRIVMNRFDELVFDDLIKKNSELSIRINNQRRTIQNLTEGIKELKEEHQIAQDSAMKTILYLNEIISKLRKEKE